ncbi:thiol-disulfide isomerase [Vibrio azureus]|uniref:Thioredoxin-like fold domain-containing protein n=1 Tax=Vibrio azureus NBRC 104587 TaxID=1219077 RepID=U3CHK1_9VIBR|nr:thioredoxin domain-containing protein [Vibrio azureus]AUI88347.1 thiol-disulfide isomerase [Vibrio azureus]GAD77728.1 hypothetical protein VAZ01S_087_00190 [Vibrio azureus NBRC 104587]
MIKSFAKSVFLLAAVLGLAACDNGNNQPQLGKQYQALPTPLTEYNLSPVTEVFSLNCGHCRKMEQFVPQIESLTEQNVKKVHVTFNESAQVSAIIFYTAVMQLNDTPDKAFMDELFSAVQTNANASPEERQTAVDHVFQTRNLVSPYQLTEEQQAKLFQLMKEAEEITTVGNIHAVPMFIINGKYQVLTSGHNTAESLANTISYLLQLAE